MSKLNKKLFEFLKQKAKISPQAIRNEISRIRAAYPSITLDAAAQVFAKKKGFSIMRFLSEDDRKSLPSSNTLFSSQQAKSVQEKKPKAKHADTSFGKDFLNDANQNADLYPYVYILENSLRKLIKVTFKDEEDWWQKRVGDDVKKYATRIQEAEKKHDWLPERGNHPIYYIGLNELFRIINKHYLTHFKRIFNDLGNLRTWINESIPIRNLLAHNVKVKKDERQNLMMRAKYICTLIEKNKIVEE